MKKLLLTLAGSAAALALAPAAQAQSVNPAPATTVMTNVDVGANGTFTIGFSDANLTNPFTETLSFNTTAAGLLSIIASTVATSAENDTDFTRVFLTGTGITGAIEIPATAGSSDQLESRGLAGINVGVGTFTLTLTGTPGTQNGSFGGTVSFVPTSAIPEPATWAFMLIGFGAVGYSMRKRPAYKLAQAV